MPTYVALLHTPGPLTSQNTQQSYKFSKQSKNEIENNNNNNHSSLLFLYNLKIMKDTLRLLLFHLRMLHYAVTIAYPFGGYARASNLVNKSGSEMHSLLLTKENLQTRINPLSNDSVRHIRRQNTHTAGGAGLEPPARKHVVPTYLPLDHLPPTKSRRISLFIII
jgi:hypothetical protein